MTDAYSSFLWDKEGQNITIPQAEQYLNEYRYTVIGRDTIGSAWIATDWMPCHMGRPTYLFETAIAIKRAEHSEDEDPGEFYIWDKYLTEAEAKIGHEKAVQHCLQHNNRCCKTHNTHSNPHVGCIFR